MNREQMFSGGRFAQGTRQVPLRNLIVPGEIRAGNPRRQMDDSF
jgi:hypothetical protein